MRPETKEAWDWGDCKAKDGDQRLRSDKIMIFGRRGWLSGRSRMSSHKSIGEERELNLDGWWDRSGFLFGGGFLPEGFLPEGFLSEGFLSEGFLSENFLSENSTKEFRRLHHLFTNWQRLSTRASLAELLGRMLVEHRRFYRRITSIRRRQWS